MNRRNAKPHGGNRRVSGAAMLDSLHALYGNKPAARIPDNWRDHLPDPLVYYGQHVAKHCAALQRLYGPDAGELRASIADGIAHAGQMLAETRSDHDCDLLAAQVYGLLKSITRLRGLLPEVTHAVA